MSVMEGLRAPKLFAERLRPPEEPRSERCLNCGAELAGPFCAQCGQRDVPPYPSVRELVTDAFWELSGWDGRFAATVRTLVKSPGRLTVDFLEGRRARYISPLRLYLLASLLYFLAAAMVPELSPSDGLVVSTSVDPNRGSAGIQQVNRAALNARNGTLTAEQRDSALKKIATAPPIIRPILQRMVGDTKGFKRSLLETMPRVLFALVPIFAAVLALFYRRRKYPEHLYFALHLHAFFFVALTLAAAAKFTYSQRFSGIMSALAAVWIIGYALVAARRVYGGSWVRTTAKGIGVSMLYSAAGVVALCVAVYVAATS
jgi:hypothetical protein